MVLGGLAADVEGLGDLWVGAAGRDQPQHLALALAEGSQGFVDRIPRPRPARGQELVRALGLVSAAQLPQLSPIDESAARSPAARQAARSMSSWTIGFAGATRRARSRRSSRSATPVSAEASAHAAAYHGSHRLWYQRTLGGMSSGSSVSSARAASVGRDATAAAHPSALARAVRALAAIAWRDHVASDRQPLFASRGIVAHAVDHRDCARRAAEGAHSGAAGAKPSGAEALARCDDVSLRRTNFGRDRRRDGRTRWLTLCSIDSGVGLPGLSDRAH